MQTTQTIDAPRGAQTVRQATVGPTRAVVPLPENHSAAEHAQRAEPLRQAIVRLDGPIPHNLDAQMAVARANDLLGLAEQTVTLAAELAQENHEEYEHAKEALAFAQAAAREITDLARDPNRRHNAREIGQKLNTMTNTVIAAATDVAQHEGHSASDSARRISHYAATQEKQKKSARSPKPENPHNPRTCRNRSHHHRDHDEDDEDRPRLRRPPTPQRPAAIPGKVQTDAAPAPHGPGIPMVPPIAHPMPAPAAITGDRMGVISPWMTQPPLDVSHGMFATGMVPTIGPALTVARTGAGMLNPVTSIGSVIGLRHEPNGDSMAGLGQLLPTMPVPGLAGIAPLAAALRDRMTT